jgi:CBS domain-containing protein
MSTGVITVKADADLAEVADLLDRRKLQRVPVMSNGKLVGILTKSDLVRALVARLGAAPAEPAGDAKEILAAIHKRTRRETWLDTSLVNINVEGTVAQISGLAASADQRRALRLLVEDTPGVSRVEDRMTIRPTAPMI